MWNLNSLYKDIDSPEFKNDFNILSILSDKLLKLNSGQDEFRDLYRDYYRKFNRIMSFVNLYNMSTDSDCSKKEEAITYLNILRNQYNKVQPIISPESEYSALLKPSSDTFKDLYYDSRRRYSKDLTSLEFNCSFALIGIKKNVIKRAEINGFNSPLEEALDLYQIPEKAFNHMIDTIERLIPYFKEKVIRNNIHRKYGDTHIDYDSGKRIVENSLNEFSKDASALAYSAFNNGWIDYSPAIAEPLCISIPSISEFRVKLDYKDDLKSLISLAHELGHGYHGHTLYHDDILEFSYPISIGETSALFFEDLVYDYLLKSKEELFVNYEELHTQYISNLSLFTMDVYARYLFERDLYTAVNRECLNPAKLNELMKNSLEYVYGKDSEVNSSLWIEKSHYYNFSRPFYNIPYIFGLFIEKILFDIYKADTYSNFSELYREFFSNTNKITISDNMNSVFGIDIEDYEIWSHFEAIIKRLLS